MSLNSYVVAGLMPVVIVSMYPGYALVLQYVSISAFVIVILYHAPTDNTSLYSRIYSFNESPDVSSIYESQFTSIYGPVAAIAVATLQIRFIKYW